MEEPMETRATGLPQEQKEQFDRVWKRVLEGGETLSCPIAWEQVVPPAQPEAAPAEQPAQVTPPADTLMPACQSHPGNDRPQMDFPQGGAGLLGADCLEFAPLLQELIRRELADWREYQLLARRTGGAPARVLTALAGEKKRHAKRLSAAYFLIAGIRYWPEGEKCTPPASYLGSLRRRFIQEQETMASYLTGAEGTTDPCLRQLFLDHAQDQWDHACKIRQLVEQA